ncbi:hypothetical protein GGI07_002270 [Coemansia sp. Benny D115]|nr:hypothetical protein GGI07_002270 [Coemansia sp. Benny D115]
MQFAKLAVSVFALAAIGAATPSPQGPQTIVRIGHANGSESSVTPAVSTDVDANSEEPSSDDEVSITDDSADESVESSDAVSEKSSSDKNTKESQVDSELSDIESDAEVSTSTVYASGDDVVISVESEDSEDSSSSGADSFRGVSVVTLAIAGGLSLIVSAF